MKILHFILIAVIIVASSGCAMLEELFPQEAPKQEAPPILEPTKFKLVLLQTPQYNFYDFATIKKEKSGDLALTFFTLGRAVANVKVSRFQICIDGKCQLKWPTVRVLMGEVSYGELLEDIFQARDIFGGQGLIIERGYWRQHFITNGQEIFYERYPGRVAFHNKTLGIFIVIEDYNHPVGK